MWHYPFWLTNVLVEERNREAERQAALERLYREAGLEPFAGLKAGGRRFAAGVGGWLVAVGDWMVVAGARGRQERCLSPCCQAGH